MKKILKFLIKFLLLLLAISFISYLLSWLAPSDPARMLLESNGTMATEEALAAMREKLGLNRPFIVQYVDWLLSALRGNLGASYRTNHAVITDLAAALPNTMLLSIASTVICVVLAVPVGAVSAYNKSGVLDELSRIASYLLISFPGFFTSLVMVYIFALKLGWFRVIGGDRLYDAILPIAMLALTTAAWMTRQVRAVFLKELEKDYVLACRARGLSDSAILWNHVLRNTALPILSLTGVAFSAILGGTIIAENIFNWSGLGQLLMRSISYRDYPVIQGYVLFMASSLLVVNGIIDLIHMFDPRERKRS